jgi:hypothetical protein
MLPRRMKIIVLLFRAGLAMLCLSLAGVGCAAYRYCKVTDPASQKSYFTPRVEKDKKLGTVTFVDSLSGVTLTVTNAQVQNLNRARFDEGLRAQARPSNP